jgi:hypothetical protein
MGGGLFVFPILVVGAVVLLLLFAWFAWAGRREAERQIPDDVPALEYLVPAGQDPVVVLTALGKEGYTASADHTQRQLLRIACPLGTDKERPRVRSVIGSVHTTALDTGMPMDPGPVRFVDES